MKQREEKDAPGQLSLRSWGLYTLGPAVNIQLAPVLARVRLKGPRSTWVISATEGRAGQGAIRTDCSDWARQVAIRRDSGDQEPPLSSRASYVPETSWKEHLGPHRLLGTKACANQGGIHIGLHREPDRATRLGVEATSKTGRWWGLSA